MNIPIYVLVFLWSATVSLTCIRVAVHLDRPREYLCAYTAKTEGGYVVGSATLSMRPGWTLDQVKERVSKTLKDNKPLVTSEPIITNIQLLKP